MQKAKRARVVTRKPGSDYCRTCRDRRVKCDGQRPRCLRCVNFGFVCKGYTTFELGFSGSTSKSPDALSPAEIPDGPSKAHLNRSQLLSRFLEDRFPHPKCAAPDVGHISNDSLPHFCASADVSAPMVRHAIETLSLTNLAARSKSRWAMENASKYRGVLLGMLQSAVSAFGSTSTVSSPKDLISSIMLVSLLPNMHDVSDSQSIVHLEGALHVLSRCEEWIFDLGQHSDVILLRLLNLSRNFLSMAQRKETEFWYPELLNSVALHSRDHDSADAWIPKRNVPSRRYMLGQPEPESVDTAVQHTTRLEVLQIPKLLMMTDEFVKESHSSLHQLEEISTFVRLADDVQTLSVQPAFKDSAAYQGPKIHRSDAPLFDVDIEEHRFLCSPEGEFIQEHFSFGSPEFGFTSLKLRGWSMKVDCAILQIIYHGINQLGLSPNWTGVGIEGVERRAKASAYELCQHVHFYSQRSLTAAKFLHAWIKAACSFYESCGSEDGRRWCMGCLDAISARIQRLSSADGPSFCPVIPVFAQLSEGCRYDRKGYQATPS